MSAAPEKTVVAVSIAGEEYKIRAHATPEYTRECAAFVDGMIRDILSKSALMPPHKAAILAALAITDQLFQAQRETNGALDRVSGFADGLAAEIEEHLAGAGSD